MKMTNEERQALIERIAEICAEYSKPNHSKAFSVKDVEIAELARIALAALTAEPAKVPWDVKSCYECGSKSLTWQATVISNTPVQNGRLRLNEVSGLFYLGCDECSETVARVDANEVACFLNAYRAEVLRPRAIDNTAQQYEALAGWKLVPVEPTAEMYDAGDKQLATKQVWDAMLGAAPKPEGEHG